MYSKRDHANNHYEYKLQIFPEQAKEKLSTPVGMCDLVIVLANTNKTIQQNFMKP